MSIQPWPWQEADAERKRGDTYRRRALALLQRATQRRGERDANDGIQDAFNIAMRRCDIYRADLTAEHDRAERLAGLLKRARRWMEPFYPFAGLGEWGEREPLKAEIDAALASKEQAG